MKTKPQTHIIHFGSRRISFILHRSNRKTLKIVVSPELIVDVYAPVHSSIEEVLSMAEKKSSWIAKKLDETEMYQPLPSPKRFVSGESLAYLGRRYRLKVLQGKKQPTKLVGRHLRVHVSEKKNVKAIQ